MKELSSWTGTNSRFWNGEKQRQTENPDNWSIQEIFSLHSKPTFNLFSWPVPNFSTAHSFFPQTSTLLWVSVETSQQRKNWNLCPGREMGVCTIFFYIRTVPNLMAKSTLGKGANNSFWIISVPIIETSDIWNVQNCLELFLQWE